MTFTTQGTLAGTLANGDTLTAFVDQSGTVFVWRATGGTATYLAGVILTNALWTTGGGRIGLQLSHQPTGARADNFAGGNVP